MATTLAPVDAREVVRCDHCHLVQFRTNNGLCRRCHASLDPDEPEILAPEPVALPVSENTGTSALQVAAAIRSLRQRSGMSQRQLAMRMNVPRTYVSKIENEKATPTLSSIERLAQALNVSVPELLSGASGRDTEVRDLLKDDFIAEIVPYLSQLNGMQLTSVLSQVRDMSLHIRRTA
ncbi:MAG TPA: helix-turn-helix transcriptional regulator [Terriglobales bacterium]|nr:helix-turn-helix transcriptional regulator [Terriglobales bacterium]